ncbi:DUF2218 domain-containing protein [Sphingomonas fennica]|uniref:DUF2218 domain-containing protein n=1 Tax=Edaphosphingomonas fennica TaxID=114404 RepID=A0A2T4HLW1_9SPHN|nr:DUF2218 domain-containing protein [Sphingomonas fennica]PTD16790.1 DUF2218 domain-containing protein [Sphingomonas fennica]
MFVTTGSVATPNAERYVRQLVKHWGHRLAIIEAEGVTTIAFGPEIILTLEPDRTRIVMRLTTPAEGEAVRFRRVFEEHLDRFAFREAPLAYQWVSAANWAG